MNPAVSVVIPAYNAASTLSRTLDSLLAQDSDTWEAIVVDDGSTDDTAAVARAYAARARTPKAIRLVRQENRGLGAARNAGIREAKTPYLHCLDADDLVEPSFYREMVVALENTPQGSAPGRCAVSGYIQFVDDGPERMRIPPPKAEAFQPEILCVHNFGPPCNFLFERSILDVCGLFDETLPHCQDWDLWLRFARAGVRFIPLENRLLCRYRLRPASLSRNHARFLRTVFTVVARAGEPDQRLPRENGRQRIVLRERVVLGQAGQWAYCLKKAASELNAQAVDEIWTLGRETLPDDFFLCPDTYGVDLAFQPVEADPDASEGEMRALYETARQARQPVAAGGGA